IYNHLLITHQILQHLQNIGATVLTKKFVLAAPDVTIVGHKCTLKGRIPHEDKYWPECQTLTQVHGFLGVCGVLCIFIWGFASITQPLVDLTRKGVPFQ
ncbi:hypothetical protein PAXINDRAFT_64981, partial [Paxillus involutus ATCC 200175]